MRMTHITRLMLTASLATGIGFSAATFTAHAQQSGTQPLPAPKPADKSEPKPGTKSPSKPEEKVDWVKRAREKTEQKAKDAADAYARWLKVRCDEKASDEVRKSAEEALDRANDDLDRAIVDEAAVDPDVKNVTQKWSDALHAELKADRDPKTSASDMASLHKKTSDLHKPMAKEIHAMRAMIRKRLEDEGYKFGKPVRACAPKEEDGTPPKTEKRSEDDPLYMDGYTPSEKPKPKARAKKNDDVHYDGPARDPDDHGPNNTDTDMPRDNNVDLPMPH